MKTYKYSSLLTLEAALEKSQTMNSEQLNQMFERSITEAVFKKILKDDRHIIPVKHGYVVSSIFSELYVIILTNERKRITYATS